MREDNDALIAQYLKGNAAAFERLYDRHAPRLLDFLLSLGADRDAAEDLAQRAWIKALEALKAYRPQGRFRPWLFTLAHRLWIDEKRSAWERNRLAVADDIETPDPASGPLETAMRRQQRQLLDQALAEMPGKLRQTVLLRVDGELTFKEIARAMKTPLGTVLWRMREAQQRLRKQLAPPPPPDENVGERETHEAFI